MATTPILIIIIGQGHLSSCKGGGQLGYWLPGHLCLLERLLTLSMVLIVWHIHRDDASGSNRVAVAELVYFADAQLGLCAPVSRDLADTSMPVCNPKCACDQLGKIACWVSNETLGTSSLKHRQTCSHRTVSICWMASCSQANSGCGNTISAS